VHQGKIPTDQPCPSPEQEERCEKGEVLNTRKKPQQIVSKNEAPGESNITHTTVRYVISNRKHQVP
jgi:hypothetical protein